MEHLPDIGNCFFLQICSLTHQLDQLRSRDGDGPFEDGVDDGADQQTGFDPVSHFAFLEVFGHGGSETVVQRKQKSFVNHLWNILETKQIS